MINEQLLLILSIISKEISYRSQTNASCYE